MCRLADLAPTTLAIMHGPAYAGDGPAALHALADEYDARLPRRSRHDAAVADADEEQIRALICAYAERLDSGDLDGVAALFEHGVFRSGRGGHPLAGRDAVRRQYEPVILYPDGDRGPTPRTKHVLGNIVVDVHGDGATGRCTFTVLQQVDDGPLRAVLGGRYHDRFERVDGRWRFTERVVHPDLLGDLSQHMGRS